MKQLSVLFAILCAAATIPSSAKASQDDALIGSHVWPRLQRHTSVHLWYMIEGAKYEIQVFREWKDGSPNTHIEVWPQPGNRIEAKKHKADLPEDSADRVSRLAQKCFKEFKVPRNQTVLKANNSFSIHYTSGIEHIGAQFFRGQKRDRYPSLETLLQELWPKPALLPPVWRDDG